MDGGLPSAITSFADEWKSECGNERTGEWDGTEGPNSTVLVVSSSESTAGWVDVGRGDGYTCICFSSAFVCFVSTGCSKEGMRLEHAWFVSLPVIKPRNPASPLRTNITSWSGRFWFDYFNLWSESQHSNRLFCMFVLSIAPCYMSLDVIFNSKSAFDLGNTEIMLSFEPHKSFSLSAPKGCRRNWTQATRLWRWEVSASSIV